MTVGAVRKNIDVKRLFQLWNDDTVRTDEICLHLMVSMGTLRTLAARYGLPRRRGPRDTSDNDAPSMAEDAASQDSLDLSPWVAAQVATLRERKLLQLKHEPVEVTQARVAVQRRRGRA